MMNKTKVRIDYIAGSWRWLPPRGQSFDEMLRGGPEDKKFSSYPVAKSAALAAGHEVDNAGWIHRLLAWQFDHHAMDGYPGWEISTDESPAFVKLAHERGLGSVESHALAAAWDDVAETDFYQRDWTSDGVPFVAQGEVYWSGWWFATVAERNRFVAWVIRSGRDASIVSSS